MGGIGSGRRSTRLTTDECIYIRQPYLTRLGMLKRSCMHRQELTWRCGERIMAQLTVVTDVHCREPHPCLKVVGYANGRQIDCVVPLDSSPMRFGGERWYALCPKTRKRCTALVLPPGRSHFASVRGWDVAYSSQRECEIIRAQRGIKKASGRLNALSKYARKPTQERLRRKIFGLLAVIDEAIEERSRLRTY